MRIKGEITDSFTDIRSAFAYEFVANDTVLAHYYTIDSTHLNQATVETCFLENNLGNQYSFINQTQNSIRITSYSYQRSNRPNVGINTLDTMSGDIGIPHTIDTSVDSLEIRFFSQPPTCLQIKGEILDSLLDIRSILAYEEGLTDTVVEENFLIRSNFYYTIDSTLRNQATLQACPPIFRTKYLLQNNTLDSILILFYHNGEIETISTNVSELSKLTPMLESILAEEIIDLAIVQFLSTPKRCLRFNIDRPIIPLNIRTLPIEEQNAILENINQFEREDLRSLDAYPLLRIDTLIGSVGQDSVVTSLQVFDLNSIHFNQATEEACN